MEHQIMITVDGYSCVGTAFTGTDDAGRWTITRLVVEGFAPSVIYGALAEGPLTFDDVCEIARSYLADTTVFVRDELVYGHHLSWLALDEDRLQRDLTRAGRYRVTATTETGDRYQGTLSALDHRGAAAVAQRSLPGLVGLTTHRIH